MCRHNDIGSGYFTDNFVNVVRFVYLWRLLAVVLCFTSWVPVTGGPPIVTFGHCQKNISNVQDYSVNKVPGESGAISNSFNLVSGLEPGSPDAPRGPVTVRHMFCDVWPLNYDPRGGVAALDVMSSLLLCLSFSGRLVVSRLSYQTHLQ